MSADRYIGPVDEQCTRKRSYRTKAYAKLTLRRSKKLDTAFRRDDLEVYRCPHCGQFHIGHKPGRKKAA